jgi:hypothetical protein
MAGFVVAVYFSDLAYGGPEEGGWWYETGDLDLIYAEQWFPDRVSAIGYRRLMQNMLDKILNHDRRPISSVRSEGAYQARVYSGGFAPSYYPATKPHYE